MDLATEQLKRALEIPNFRPHVFKEICSAFFRARNLDGVEAMLTTFADRRPATPAWHKRDLNRELRATLLELRNVPVCRWRAVYAGSFTGPVLDYDSRDSAEKFVGIEGAISRFGRMLTNLDVTTPRHVIGLVNVIKHSDNRSILVEQDGNLTFDGRYVHCSSMAYVTGNLPVVDVHDVEEPGILPTQYFTRAHYHYVIDKCSAYRYATQLPGDHVVYLTAAPGSRDKVFLDHWGISPERVRVLSPSGTYRFRELHVPCMFGGIPRAFLEACQEIADRLHRQRGTGTGEKIYVSRRSARARVVENEGEVEDYLAGQGFTIVRLEDMSFPDQIAAMRGARVIVGPHGSGLANTIFCRPGTKLVELTCQEFMHSYFARISVVCDLEYVRVRALHRYEGSYRASLDIVRDSLSGA